MKLSINSTPVKSKEARILLENFYRGKCLPRVIRFIKKLKERGVAKETISVMFEISEFEAAQIIHGRVQFFTLEQIDHLYAHLPSREMLSGFLEKQR